MKTEMSVDRFIKLLAEHGFDIEHNANKLEYLDEALENHNESEVYTRIVYDTFERFRDWAQRKNIARMHSPETDELQSLINAAMAWIMSDKNRELLREVIKGNEKIPEWRQHLIDKSFVYDDGKRVKDNLDGVAAELVKYTEQPTTSQFLRENFLKNDGSTYSDKTCEQARDRANTNNKINPKAPPKPLLKPH